MKGRIDIFDHEDIRTLLMDPNRTEDVRSIWRKNRLEYLSSLTKSTTPKKHRLKLGKMINNTPVLKARSLARWKKTETLLAVSIAKDAGADPEDMSSRALASMLVSTHLEVLRRWAKSNARLDARKLYEETLDYIDRIFVRSDDVK